MEHTHCNTYILKNNSFQPVCEHSLMLLPLAALLNVILSIYNQSECWYHSFNTIPMKFRTTIICYILKIFSEHIMAERWSYLLFSAMHTLNTLNITTLFHSNISILYIRFSFTCSINYQYELR